MTEIRVAVALRVKIHARWKDPLLAKDARSGAPKFRTANARCWPGLSGLGQAFVGG
jgi:hypothetical protein